MAGFLGGAAVADVRVVLITAPDLERARELARELVGAHLAACANLVPGLTSVYRWEGAVQEDAEALLVVKTTAQRLEALRQLVARIHPYDVPELVVLTPAAVEERYLAWLLAQCSEGRSGQEGSS